MAKTLDMGDSGNAVEILRYHYAGRETDIHTGVEIGVHRGGLSAKLLAAFPNLVLCMVDPWATYPADHPYSLSVDGCAGIESNDQAENKRVAESVTNPYQNRRLILKLTSERAVLRVPYPKVSFAFIDGDHTFEMTDLDIRLWWPKVEPGGILMGHDYGHPHNKKGWGVNRAVDAFVAENELQSAFGTMGSCWFIRKG